MTNVDKPGGSHVEVFICPSSAEEDISEDTLSYFESPLRTLHVCQVKPSDREERDEYGKYWPVIFRPSGDVKHFLLGKMYCEFMMIHVEWNVVVNV